MRCRQNCPVKSMAWGRSTGVFCGVRGWTMAGRGKIGHVTTSIELRLCRAFIELLVLPGVTFSYRVFILIFVYV